MKILAINTAQTDTSIAVIVNGKTLSSLSWPSKKDEADKLLPAIDKMLKSKKTKYDEVGKIIVVKGPGSFTGLRIGVAVANAIAYLIKKPVYSIDTFKFIWAANAKIKNSALVLFAGKKEIYIQFEKSQKPLLKDLSEAEKILKRKNIKTIFGDLHDEQIKALSQFKFIKSKKTFGQIIAKLTTKDLKKSEIVEPSYIKGPSITQPKKQI